MDAWYHSKSSARKWGGAPEDYLAIHQFIDSSKNVIGDIRHRSVYHHTLGVVVCQRIFGVVIDVGRRQVPVKQIAERHIVEDLGWLPTPADYLKEMPVQTWMSGSRRRTEPLSLFGLRARFDPTGTPIDPTNSPTGKEPA